MELYYNPPYQENGENKLITRDRFVELFGKKAAVIADGYVEERKPYSKDFAAVLWKIHRGEIPKIETGEQADRIIEEVNRRKAGMAKAAVVAKKKETKAPKKGLLNIENGVVQKGTIWSVLKTKAEIMVYMTLNSFIVRAPMDNDPHNLYQGYYKKRRLLACAVAYNTLQKRTGLGRANIAAALNRLEKEGIIGVEKSKAEEKHYRRQNIYLLGRVDRDENEEYMLEKYIVRNKLDR